MRCEHRPERERAPSRLGTKWGHGIVAFHVLRFWQVCGAIAMNPLAILGAFGLIFGIGSGEVRRFERAVAAEISQKLGGEGRKVSVSTQLNGLAGVWGDLKTATIRASHFETVGLPLFTEPGRRTNGRVGLLKIELSDFVQINDTFLM